MQDIIDELMDRGYLPRKVGDEYSLVTPSNPDFETAFTLRKEQGWFYLTCRFMPKRRITQDEAQAIKVGMKEAFKEQIWVNVKSADAEKLIIKSKGMRMKPVTASSTIEQFVDGCFYILGGGAEKANL